MLVARASTRLPVAALAALGSVVICIVQRHVHVLLSEPGTYANVLHHRCGLLMVGCVGWLLFELARSDR